MLSCSVLQRNNRRFEVGTHLQYVGHQHAGGLLFHLYLSPNLLQIDAFHSGSVIQTHVLRGRVCWNGNGRWINMNVTLFIPINGRSCDVCVCSCHKTYAVVVKLDTCHCAFEKLVMIQLPSSVSERSSSGWSRSAEHSVTRSKSIWIWVGCRKSALGQEELMQLTMKWRQ